MPIVSVETWPLKEGQRPELIKKVTDVFVGMGIRPRPCSSKRRPWDAGAAEVSSIR